MYISKIIIKGFKSFNQEGSVLDVKNKLNAFIGLNSSGKTTALEALLKVFGSTYAEKDICRQDFHIAPNEDVSTIEERSLVIEVKLSFDDSDKDSIPHFFNQMVLDGEGKEPYIRIRLESKWSKSDFSEEGEVETNLYFINIPEGDTENDESKRSFPKHLKSLIQILYIPAIRKPGDQIRFVTGSIFYRVLQLINFDEEFKSDFEAKLNEINSLFGGLKEFSEIQTSLSSFWKKFHKDERYKESNLGFGSSDINSMLKKLEVSFSPTGIHREFQINDLGEGYRSLFYLTLVCTLLEVEEKLSKGDNAKIRPLLTILAIEEPENHIAPQLLGRVISILESISKKDKSQVFMSSHTPAIIKRIEPESIFHFRITEKYSTQINPITLPDKKDEAYKYIKEAITNYPEIYFAKLAVIGEGDSEDIIFNRLMKTLNVDFDDNIISFIPLGHRFVNHIWKLLKTLKIPYITLLDLDVERNGGGWGRIKYVLQQLIASGVEKNILLSTSKGKILSDERLAEMHNWQFSDNKINVLLTWVTYLESYNVFFSTPLDIDFLMLEHYEDYYKKGIPTGGGPNIPDKVTLPQKFENKLKSALQATLKSETANALTYTDNQKELMIWYNYHFLGRGKPSTHIAVISSINDEEIIKQMPPVFERMFKRIEELLNK